MKQDVRLRIGFVGLRTGTGACSCEHGNENFRVPQDGGKFSRGITGGAQLRGISQWDRHCWHFLPNTALELRVA
jgi:hypothetical protein